MRPAARGRSRRRPEPPRGRAARPRRAARVDRHAVAADRTAPSCEIATRGPGAGHRPGDAARHVRRAARASRAHEAIDILAPRNTPVIAVEDGTIASCSTARRGGITVYQFDPDRRRTPTTTPTWSATPTGCEEGRSRPARAGDRLCRHAPAMRPKNTPHLHFAIFRLHRTRSMVAGQPIDPYRRAEVDRRPRPPIRTASEAGRSSSSERAGYCRYRRRRGRSMRRAPSRASHLRRSARGGSDGVANPEIGDLHAAEPDRPDDPALERSGGGRFAPAGIRPGQQRVLLEADAPRLSPGIPGQHARDAPQSAARSIRAGR